jgi:tetratricopeptide (TPR) repeat protein
VVARRDTLTAMRLTILLVLTLAAALAACSTPGPPAASRPPPGTPVPPPTGAAAGAAAITPPGPPAAPPPRQFHLGTAASALVAQAHRQAASGDYGEAATTLERALRIEPDNPLLWIELGRVRMGENNAAQADAMGRKALALATGDPAAQASAWRLIADSLRARGRNADAYEADRHANGLATPQ